MTQVTTDSLTAEQLMRHMRALCVEIGGRKPTSLEERRAAEYVRRVLEDLEIADIQDQFFVSADSWGWSTIPYMAVAAFAPLLGGWFGRLLGGAALLWSAKGLRDVTLAKPPPFFSLVAQGASQNVIARIPPSGEVKRHVYVVAHLDSNKQRFMAPMPIREMTKPFGTFGIGFMALTGGLMIFAALTGRKTPRFAQRVAGFVGVLSLLLSLFDETQPTVEGANDNATAVAVALGVAAAVRANPLRHTEVTVLFTGCEEVGCVGMESYLERYKPPKDNSYWIDLEMVGTGRLGYASKHGINHYAEYHPGGRITATAAQVARENPALRVNGKDMLIVEEVAGLRRRGYEAICIVGYDDQGFLPNWHRLSDTLDHIEPDTLERAARYTHKLMQALDAEA